MQTLKFDSDIIGLSSSKNNYFLLSTKSDGLYIIDQTKTIKRQIPYPIELIPTDLAIWSHDGSIIWIPSGSFLFYSVLNFDNLSEDRSSELLQFNNIKVSDVIVKVIKQSSFNSVIVVLQDNSVLQINHDKQVLLHKYDEEHVIIDILTVDREIYEAVFVVVSCDKPFVDIYKAQDGSRIGSIDIPRRESSLIYAVYSRDMGVVLIWIDGFWSCYNENSTNLLSSGRVCSAHSYFLLGSHLACSCDEYIKIYDLKFDAELQEINIESDSSSKMVLFNNSLLVSSFQSNLRFREWIGTSQTTTRNLIGSFRSNFDQNQKIPETIEVKLNIQQNKTMEESADFEYKSLKHTVHFLTQGGYVTKPVIEMTLNNIKNEKETDIKHLSKFHLSNNITVDEIEGVLNSKQPDIATILLKKTKFDSDSFLRIFRLCMQDKENEVILAHLVTQPLDQSSLRMAVKQLSGEECNFLLLFLSKIIRSRRFWRDFETSISALNSALRLASIIISENNLALKMKGITGGLIHLYNELKEEMCRIEKAGDCWSLLQNVASQDNNNPPTFMYTVDTINIPNFD